MQGETRVTNRTKPNASPTLTRPPLEQLALRGFSRLPRRSAKSEQEWEIAVRLPQLKVTSAARLAGRFR